jgi:hypothetical protein
MENEFDYKQAAEAIINRLGGKDETRRSIWKSEKNFRDSLLPDAVQSLFPDADADEELLFGAVIDYIKQFRGDTAKDLLSAKNHLEQADTILNDLLFYHTYSSRRKH